MVTAAVDLGAERCLAFVLDESPGSTHTVGLARRAGLWTTVYRASSTPEDTSTGERIRADVPVGF